MTPVKNEAWILDRFLQCASTWADHIVVADQRSTDGSREIARSFNKVTLIDNDTPAYDEQARQKLLINAARSLDVDGPRVLIALDADEILTANWMTSPEWQRAVRSAPGSVLGFRWVNVGPDVSGGWLDDEYKAFGYVDDGRPHVGHQIHSPRVPVHEDSPWLRLQDIHVLHYQYANWERMESKQRWYQCWERLNHPDKRPITIYRQYNFMHADVEQSKPLDPSWLQGYEDQGIDMRTIDTSPHYHWDRDVVEMIREHGAETFEKIAIWDVDWTEKGRAMDFDVNGELEDPRSPFSRFVHQWLQATQSQSQNPVIRGVQKCLQLRGW